MERFLIPLAVFVIAGLVWLLFPVEVKTISVQEKRQKVDAAMAYKRPYAPASYAAYQVQVDGCWLDCSKKTWHALEAGKIYRLRIRNKRIIHFETVS